jgi:hypothetical protein
LSCRGETCPFQVTLTMSATGPPEIHVYTSLTRAVALGTDLDVDPSNWHWVHCLSFPLETLTTLQFSQKPYKWIRYAVGVVVGAEGDLSFSSDLPSVVDYEAGLPSELTVLYYHTSEEEKRRMFPVDPDMRTSVTSSLATTRRVHFSGDVAKRDRGTCVMTGAGWQTCDAAHLLAHAKGDNVRHSHSQSTPPHHGSRPSTLRRILSVVAESLLGRTLYETLTASGTAFS